MLLLFKEKLRQLSPPDSDEVLIKKNILPVPMTNGIHFVGKGAKTVDVAEIKERFGALGIAVEWKRVDAIVQLRNQLEHYKDSGSPAAMKKLVADTFAVVSAFSSEYLKEEPLALLGESTWGAMLSEYDVYEQTKTMCVASMDKIGWDYSALAHIAEHFVCSHCEGDLGEPIDPTVPKTSLEFACKSCGKISEFSDIIETACDEAFAGEHYLAVTDGGNVPTSTCHECSLDTFVEEEGVCVACEYASTHP
jgi:hypothetical protein